MPPKTESNEVVISLAKDVGELSALASGVSEAITSLAKQIGAVDDRRKRSVFWFAMPTVICLVALVLVIFVAFSNRSIIKKINNATGADARQAQVCVLDQLKRTSQVNDNRLMISLAATLKVEPVLLPVDSPVAGCADVTPAGSTTIIEIPASQVTTTLPPTSTSRTTQTSRGVNTRSTAPGASTAPMPSTTSPSAPPPSSAPPSTNPPTTAPPLTRPCLAPSPAPCVTLP